MTTATQPPAPRSLAGVPLETAEAREALTRARVGEAIAYGRVVGLYHDRLYNAAFRLVGRHDDAADITQAAFAQGLDRAVTFPGDAEPYAWLFRLALDAAVTRLRRRGPAEPDAESLADPVAAALAELDVEYRSLLVMVDVERFAATRISAITQAPVPQVRRRLFDARLALRERLSKHLKRKAAAVPQAAPASREELSAYLDGDLDAANRDRVGRCLVERPAYGQIVGELLEAKRLLRELPRVSAQSADGRLEAGAAVDPTLARLERKALLAGPQPSGFSALSPATIGLGVAILLVIGLGVAAAALLPGRSGNRVMTDLAAAGVQVEPDAGVVPTLEADTIPEAVDLPAVDPTPPAIVDILPRPGATLTLDTADSAAARRAVADVLLGAGVAMGFDRDEATDELIVTADAVPLSAWPTLLDRLTAQGSLDGSIQLDRRTIGGVDVALPPANGQARIVIRQLPPRLIPVGPTTRPRVIDPFDPFGDWGM